MKNWVYRFLSVTLCFILAACAPSSGSEGEGESDKSGEALFHQSVLGGAAGCATCHALEPGAILVGPSLAGIGSQAETRLENISAEEYIRQSILEPDTYVVEGFPKGVMPATYQDNLSQDEVDSLVTYLLSLK